jgi:hypothetical protein
MKTMMIDPYAQGALLPEIHDRLVADIDNIARDAAIQPAHIFTPLVGNVSPKEVDWVKKFKFHTTSGKSGLCLIGKNPNVDVEDRMAAIAGALVRNFIRARIFTLSQIMDLAERSEVPEPTCLLIPNFFQEKSAAGQMSSWKIPQLLDILVQRRIRGLQTVIHVSSMHALDSEYGSAFAKHVNSHFEHVTV